jgi:hypothetical protein
LQIAGTQKATHSANTSSSATFNVPEASSGDYGVIKVSSKNSSAVTVNSKSTTAGRYYPIELNSDGKAIVNVPWTDTYHKHTAGTGITLSDTTADGDGSHDVKIDIKTAGTGEIGGIKVAKANSAYTVATNTSSISANVTSGKYYGVEIDKNNKAFVYVPWSDTDNDTKNTAGATHSGSDLYIIGATS